MRLKENSHFVFVAISGQNPENPNDKERFINDIFHGVYILQKLGVEGERIAIVSDWASSDWEAQGFPPIGPIYPYDTCSYLQSIDAENLFVISSCHGGLSGIGGVDSIKPFDLVNAIKKNANITNCLVFFGQCYAGVFNYSNVSDENKNIVYIGATGMRSGLSTLLKWDIDANQSFSWCANIAVYYMFKWLESPVDVDGDGLYSIMDLYKYVSFKTNEKTEIVEKAEEFKFLNTKIATEIDKRLQSGKSDVIKALDAQAVDALIQYIIPHQDCWILNAIPASSMHFEYD